jgi:hypothetical protein
MIHFALLLSVTAGIAQARAADRDPTPAELAAARAAHEAVGGEYHRSHALPPDRVGHRLVLPRRLSPEIVVKLPNLPFRYLVSVTVTPDTPPGALAGLGRLKNLRRVEIGIMSGENPTVEPHQVPYRIAELAAVPILEGLGLPPSTDMVRLPTGWRNSC